MYPSRIVQPYTGHYRDLYRKSDYRIVTERLVSINILNDSDLEGKSEGEKQGITIARACFRKGCPHPVSS